MEREACRHPAACAARGPGHCRGCHAASLGASRAAWTKGDRRPGRTPRRRGRPPAPVPPAKLRFARWFLAAGWPVGSAARLFGLRPHDLANAVRNPPSEIEP